MDRESTKFNIRINSWTATWVQHEKPMDLKICRFLKFRQMPFLAAICSHLSHLSWRWICWSATSRWAGITRVWRGLAEDFLFGSRSGRLQVEHARNKQGPIYYKNEPTKIDVFRNKDGRGGQTRCNLWTCTGTWKSSNVMFSDTYS